MLTAITLLFTAQVGTAAPPARIGLNFPFRSPETTNTETFLLWLADLGAPAMRQMTYNDVHWVQVEPTDNAFDYSRPDLVFSNAYNIRPVPTLYGISAGGNDTVGLQVPWLACTNVAPGCGWHALRDAAVTENYVTNTVARYRGVVKFWEVSNEMNTKTTRPMGLPVPDFAGFMQSNRVWIQAVDSNALVVLPGLLGTYGFPISESTNWLHQFLELGGGSTFDIANYHDYNSWWTLPTHFDMVRNTLAAHGLTNLPIWVTETGISSRTNSFLTPRYSSVDEQAADVWRRLALLFGKGAEFVVWHTLYSSGSPSGDGWDEFGVLDARGRKKKSWHSMKLAIQQLEGFVSASLLSSGVSNDDNTNGGAGAWAVKFTCADGVTRYVLWSPDNQSLTLTGLTANVYQTLRVVPTALSADLESATFTTNTISPSGGEYTFALTGIPIVVEALPPSPFSLRAEQDGSGRTVLVWPADLGGSTTLETRDALDAGSWSPAGDGEFSIVTAGTEVRATDLRPRGTQQFYRLRWDAP